MKYSIITPVYNSYSKMEKYFESLSKQTYSEFELIIVDDCSNESEYILLKERLQRSFLKYKIIRNEENKGAGFSRNIAIENCIGEYIVFVDSDDYVHNKFLEEINNIIINNSIDLIFFDFIKVKDNQESVKRSFYGRNQGYITTEDAIVYSSSGVCGKVFASKIINEKKYLFPNIIRYEDWVFNVLNIQKCKNIYYLKKSLYYYVDNSESIVNINKNSGKESSIKAFNIINKNIFSQFRKLLKVLFAKEVIYTSVKEIIKSKKKYSEIRKEIGEICNTYPGWYKYSNFKKLPIHHQIYLFLIQNKMIYILKLLSKIK